MFFLTHVYTYTFAKEKNTPYLSTRRKFLTLTNRRARYTGLPSTKHLYHLNVLVSYTHQHTDQNNQNRYNTRNYSTARIKPCIRANNPYNLYRDKTPNKLRSQRQARRRTSLTSKFDRSELLFFFDENFPLLRWIWQMYAILRNRKFHHHCSIVELAN